MYKGWQIFTHRYTDGGFYAVIYHPETEAHSEVNTEPAPYTGTRFGFDSRSKARTAAKKRINENNQQSQPAGAPGASH